MRAAYVLPPIDPPAAEEPEPSMEPRLRDVIGAGLLASVLLGLVALIFFGTWAAGG